MGWTTVDYEGDIVTTLKRHFFDSDEEVLKCEKGNRGVYYFALKRKNQDKVYAEIILTEIVGNELSFKNMSENSAPFTCEASKEFIYMLTPTDDEYALEWRRRCLGL